MNVDNLKITIKKTKEIKKELTSSNKLNLLKKWHPIDHIIDWYSIQSVKGRGRKWVISSRFLFYCFLFIFVYFYFFVVVLFVEKNIYPLLSCFINLILIGLQLVTGCILLWLKEKKCGLNKFCGRQPIKTFAQPVIFFEGCLPQNLLSLLWNTLFHM